MSAPNSQPLAAPEYQVFLQYLQNARLEKHLSQREMAERLGVTPAHIQQCESGAHPMNVVEVRDWCRACGIALTDFALLVDEALEAATHPTDAPNPAF